MAFLTTATLSWFDDGCCDVKYLDLWANEAASFTPGQVLDTSWQQDHHEVWLGHDGNGRLFQHAAQLLLHYLFYPPTLLTPTSDFTLGKRSMRTGDMIIQRIHLAAIWKYHLLDVIGVNRIYEVTQEPRLCGFKYITLAPHITEGEWAVNIKWHPDGNLILSLEATSRPAAKEPQRNHKFIRTMQKKAYQQGIKHFKKRLAESPYQP